MYSVNWTNLVTVLLPDFLRKDKWKAWMGVLISQVKYVYDLFIAHRDATILKVSYTGQIIYLEKRLNDKFAATSGGIYIDNVADVSRDYLFNKAEGQDKVYVYNKWKVGTAYVLDNYVNYQGKIYKALGSTTGDQPDTNPAQWEYTGDEVLYLENKSEQAGQLDFIVMVPVALSFDINEMKGIVNFYKLAGKRYSIQTY